MNTSCIFVVEYSEFLKMDASLIQTIFRTRHILVLNTPLAEEPFNDSTLQRLASLDRPRYMQGEFNAHPSYEVTHDHADISRRKLGAIDGCLVGATLRDLLSEAKKPNNGRILNALDIPVGTEMRSMLPFECALIAIAMQGFADASTKNRHLASWQEAWQQSRGEAGLSKCFPPYDHLIWATAAMKQATSWLHIDTDGLCTAVDQVAGAKFWVVCRPRCDAPSGDRRGDMNSMHAFGKNWEPHLHNSEHFEHEAVILRPGTAL
jgi:hypothetical protein